MRKDTLGLKHELPPRTRLVLTLLSFLLPVLLWCAVSYVPWLWHPQVHITDAGEVESFSEGMDLPLKDYEEANAAAVKEGLAPGTGHRVNPVYLPAPHEVLRAFHTAFTTPPRLPNPTSPTGYVISLFSCYSATQPVENQRYDFQNGL